MFQIKLDILPNLLFPEAARLTNDVRTHEKNNSPHSEWILKFLTNELFFDKIFKKF